MASDLDFHRRVWPLAVAATILATPLSAGELSAQTDYYNTDRGRPVRIEDASTVERGALELKLATLRLERGVGGVYRWDVEPELAYGLLPRTSVELGFPLAGIDGGAAGTRTRGLAGLELSVFHALNVESSLLPAFALRADVLLPVGGLSPKRGYPALTAIATRSQPWGRLHVNAQYTFGSGPEDPDHGPELGAAHLSRWMAGVAVDRAVPLRSLLLIGNVFAEQPMEHDASLQWHAEGGVRVQLNPYLALDAGAGRRFGEEAWYVTFGGAWHLPIGVAFGGSAR